MARTKDCETRPGRDVNGYGVLTWNDEAYGPRLLSYQKADQFIQFVGDKTGLDPHHQTEDVLEELAGKFGRAYP